MRTRRSIKLGENLSPEVRAQLGRLIEIIGDNFEVTTENISSVYSKEMKSSFKANGEDYFSVLSANSRFLSAYSDVNAAYMELENRISKLQDVIYEMSEELK